MDSKLNVGIKTDFENAMLELRQKVPNYMIRDFDINLEIVEIDTLPGELSNDFHNKNSGSQSKYEICLVERFE